MGLETVTLTDLFCKTAKRAADANGTIRLRGSRVSSYQLLGDFARVVFTDILSGDFATLHVTSSLSRPQLRSVLENARQSGSEFALDCQRHIGPDVNDAYISLGYCNGRD